MAADSATNVKNGLIAAVGKRIALVFDSWSDKTRQHDTFGTLSPTTSWRFYRPNE